MMTTEPFIASSVHSKYIVVHHMAAVSVTET